MKKLLAGGLNEKTNSSTRSRLLRFAPGVYSTESLVDDYREEV